MHGSGDQATLQANAGSDSSELSNKYFTKRFWYSSVYLAAFSFQSRPGPRGSPLLTPLWTQKEKIDKRRTERAYITDPIDDADRCMEGLAF